MTDYLETAAADERIARSIHDESVDAMREAVASTWTDTESRDDSPATPVAPPLYRSIAWGGGDMAPLRVLADIAVRLAGTARGKGRHVTLTLSDGTTTTGELYGIDSYPDGVSIDLRDTDYPGATLWMADIVAVRTTPQRTCPTCHRYDAID